MLRTFNYAVEKLNTLTFEQIQTLTKGDDIYFKGKDICDILGYNNNRDALRKHVSEENKKKLSELRDVAQRDTLDNTQSNSPFVNESGLYELIFGSQLPAAKEFRKWVMNEVLPQIRKTGKYNPFNGKNQLVFKIEDENDLHFKVVNYLRRFYPEVIHIAGLGEQQYTSEMRIEAWKKGYIKGQPDLLITNYHKWYRGFCLEFKTPKGVGRVSEHQRELLDRLEKNGYKVLISNDYDVIIREINEYCGGLRIPCPHCCKRFVKEVTLQSHLKWFHRIE